jgi:hypothetical protein
MNDEFKPTPSEAAAEPPARKSNLFALVMALWGCTLVLVGFLYFKAYGSAGAKADAAQTEYWGEVRTVEFRPGVGPFTQIETDRKTFLVFGAWLVGKGAPLERREGFWGQKVCVVGTEQCRELASKP